MAERERFGADLRAVALGLRRAVVVAVPIFALAYALSVYLFSGILRDFGWGDRTPGGVACALFGAGVGAVAGWSKMRASRRVRVGGGTVAKPLGKPGARALELARISDDSKRPESTEGRGIPNRWSADLLRSGDVLPNQE